MSLFSQAAAAKSPTHYISLYIVDGLADKGQSVDAATLEKANEDREKLFPRRGTEKGEYFGKACTTTHTTFRFPENPA